MRLMIGDREVKVGDKVTTFRDEEVEVLGIYEPGGSGGGAGGRVEVLHLDASTFEPHRIYFPGVIRADFKD